LRPPSKQHAHNSQATVAAAQGCGGCRAKKPAARSTDLRKLLAERSEMLDVHPLQLLHRLQHRLRTFDIVTVPAPLIDDGALPLEEPHAIRYVTLSLFQVIEKHLAIHYQILPPFLAGPSRAAALLRTVVKRSP
jgi:hypothetical protein